MRRLLGSAGLIVGARVAGSLLTLFYTLLLATVAPAAEVGTAFGALSLGFILSVGASLNVEAGSIRFLPLYIAEGRTGDAAGFVLWCRRVVLAVSAVVLVPAALWFAFGAESAAVPYLLSLAAAPVVANARINSRHATALGLVLQGTLPRILVRPLLLSGVFGICALAGVTVGATAIMATFLAASCLAASLQWLLIRHAMAFRKEAVPRFAAAREWSVLGLMLVPMLLLGEYLRDLVILSGSLVLAPPELARLGIALSLIGVLSFGLTAVDMIFSPRVARALVKDQPREAARLLTLCGAGKLAALAVGGPVAWLLIPVALRLMGSAYAGLETTFLALALIPLSMAVFGPATLVLNVLGHRRELFAGALAGGLVLVAACVAGGHFGGLRGVTLGAALATAAVQALFWALCRRRTGVDATVLSRWRVAHRL